MNSLSSVPNKSSPKPKGKSRKGRKNRRAQIRNSLNAGVAMNGSLSREVRSQMSGGSAVAAAYSGGWVRGEPIFLSPQAGGLIRLRHCEFVTSVAGATTFTATSMSINPGLVTMFPWLSQIANNFESYVFHALSFQFVTKKSSATAGDVMIAVDFDAADATPTSEQEMTSFQGYSTNSVWRNFASVQSAKNLRKSLTYYTRQAAVANTDIKTYDVGNLVYAVDACADTTSIGRLLVCYDIELLTPQMYNPLTSPISERVDGGGSISDTAVFGTVPVYEGNSLATAASSTLTFAQPGQYSVVLYTGGTGLNIVPTISASTATTKTQIRALGNTTATVLFEMYQVVTTAANQTFVYDCSAATTVTSCSAYISLFGASNWSLMVRTMVEDRLAALEKYVRMLEGSKIQFEESDDDDFTSVKGRGRPKSRS